MSHKRLKKDWRGRKKGSVFRTKEQTLFRPAKHKYLADIVSLKNPLEAEHSAQQLILDFDMAKTRAKKVRVKRATVQARNRAYVAHHDRKDLSPAEKKEMLEVSLIYERAYKRMILPPKNPNKASTQKLDAFDESMLNELVERDVTLIGISDEFGWDERVTLSSLKNLKEKGLASYDGKNWTLTKKGRRFVIDKNIVSRYHIYELMRGRWAVKDTLKNELIHTYSDKSSARTAAMEFARQDRERVG